jgi:pyruvate dehydrogenase E2 component (dihydrolipoamide acetyltransferase)
MGDFTMPSLGADMEEGTVNQWLVKPGDEVHRGDVVAVVETEKSTIEIEVFENGVVDELVVREGETVPVGTVIARLTSETTAPSAPSVPVPLAEEAARTDITPVGAIAATVHSPVIRHLAEQLHVDLSSVTGTEVGGTVTRADVERAGATTAAGAPPEARPAPQRRGRRHRMAKKGAPGRIPSSPYARRLAAQLGVDLATVEGSGPGGSVLEADVRRAAAAPGGRVPSRQVGDKQVAMRQAIGALMARSKREIPHYYLSTGIDVAGAVTWLERANLERPVTSRLVLPALLVKATARAVAKVPEMNGFFVDDEFRPSAAVHLGVAISLRSGGVIAPAIHDADTLALDDLMHALRDLVVRARSGVLRSSEMSDPTITVTNLGELGVESVFGVIYPPQVALVGFGQVGDRVVARDGMVGVRPCLTATLSADHRASDGHRGGRFLAEIDRLLQEPETL